MERVTYDSHGNSTNKPLPDTKSKMLELSKNDLVQLVMHLEVEVCNRDAAINEILNQQTKQLLYQAKYGRFGASDPFFALQRDSDKVINDNFDHSQVKMAFDNQLQQLENLIETQRKAQNKMKEQKVAADDRYKKVCQDLEVIKQRYALDAAQGDDFMVALEKEREKLQCDLAYAKKQNKRLEKKLKKINCELEQHMSLATKHKQVAIDLIKERRKMVGEIVESEKRNQSIAQLLQKEREDSKKTENGKLLQLEARMEKQLMDFDIEREQYKARIRKEESKVRDLIQQLNEIKETVLNLQRDSASPTSNTSQSSTDNSRNISKPTSPDTEIDNHTPVLMTSSSVTILNCVSNDNPPQTARILPGASLSPPASQSDHRIIIVKKSAVQDSSDRISSAPQLDGKSVNSVIQKVSQNTDSPLESNASLRVKSPVVNNSHQNISSQSYMVKKIKPSPITIPNPSSQTSKSKITEKIINSNIAHNQSQAAEKITVTSAAAVDIIQVTSAQTKSGVLTESSHLDHTNSTISVSTKSNVPPHLGSAANLDNKSLSGWRNSAPPSLHAAEEDSNNTKSKRSSMKSPTEGIRSPTLSKSKPPPPVRNVSLPPSKKYQPLDKKENSNIITQNSGVTH